MEFDTSQAIRGYLKANGILGMDKEERPSATARLVASIPWGEGRSIEEALVTRRAGTCTGKHLVLQACFDELGIPYRPVVCTFRWGDQQIDYPANLREILTEGEWEHGHNFVQVLNPTGTYLDLDITWNPELKPYCFKALPEGWDGTTPFVGVDNIIRRWDGVEIGSMKKMLIDYLTPEARERRERFLKGFITWVRSINGR